MFFYFLCFCVACVIGPILSITHVQALIYCCPELHDVFQKYVLLFWQYAAAAVRQLKILNCVMCLILQLPILKIKILSLYYKDLNKNV